MLSDALIPLPKIAPSIVVVEPLELDDFPEKIWPLASKPRKRVQQDPDVSAEPITQLGWDILVSGGEFPAEQGDDMSDWSASSIEELDDELQALLDAHTFEEEAAAHPTASSSLPPDVHPEIAPAENALDAETALEAAAAAAPVESDAPDEPDDDHVALPPPAEAIHREPPARVPRVLHQHRLRAEAEVLLEGCGTIRYHTSKEGFQATCHRHDTCILSRTSHQGRGHAGRPVGFLAHWLLTEASTREAHKSKDLLRSFSRADRSHARHIVAGLPGGETLLERERVARDGEGSEPEDLLGIV